jgi:uncharacterized protein
MNPRLSPVVRECRRRRLVRRAPWALALILWALAGARPAIALDLPAKPTHRINDFASVLDSSVRNELENRLARFEEKTSNQIVVAILPSLEDESLEDYANRLFQHWELGQREHDNGVLLAVFMAERKIRIEVGYGLEGALTDALCSRIIRDEIAPAFRRGDYEAGIRRGLESIELATRGEYKAKPSPPRRARPRDDAGPGPGSVMGGIVMGIFILVLIWVILVNQARSYTIDRKGGRRKGNDYTDWWGGSGGGGFFGGGGGFSGGGGGGGGFSGGGGSSGGGGASGGW